LLASSMTAGEMRDHLGVTSLEFVSLDGLYRACGLSEGRNPNRPQYCDACFSGEYPVQPSDMVAKGFKLKEPA
ncbi:MAG: amidophosphoribosyltransferase, partial [Pseudomonadota bacterium]